MSLVVDSNLIQTRISSSESRVCVFIRSSSNSIQFDFISGTHQTIGFIRSNPIGCIRRSLPGTVTTKVTSILTSSRSGNQASSTSNGSSRSFEGRVGSIGIRSGNSQSSDISLCHRCHSGYMTQSIYGNLIQTRGFGSIRRVRVFIRSSSNSIQFDFVFSRHQAVGRCGCIGIGCIGILTRNTKSGNIGFGYSGSS